jgi:hypothetical protein
MIREPQGARMGRFIEAFSDFFGIVEQNPLAVFALIIVVLSIIAFAFYRGGHEKIRSAGLLAVIMVSVALGLAFLPLTPNEPAQDPKPAAERKPDRYLEIEAVSFYPTASDSPSWLISEIAVNDRYGGRLMKHAEAKSCWSGRCRDKGEGSQNNAINGKIRLTLGKDQDFWSPSWKDEDSTQWIRVVFVEPVKVKTVTLYQVESGRKTSAQTKTPRYTAHARQVRLTFSDNDPVTVEFPNKSIATVTIP